MAFRPNDEEPDGKSGCGTHLDRMLTEENDVHLKRANQSDPSKDLT